MNLNFLSSIPSSAKSVVMVMTMCSPVIMIAGAAQPSMIKWYFGGYAVLCVVASVGAFFVGKRQKKKAKDFSEDIKDNAGDTQGVRDADRLREIDDLRQQFQRGIDIYKQYGKDLYGLPWFVLVGEAGSGKTEALRRSEIGFPDKLQDYWQGTGGTLSMHWWFTNRAVILDTAGRLFVRDGAAGTEGPQTQWISFLQMLRKNRPDCPINGLVLVIPATSLVPLADPAAEADSLKEIDAKAGQIAKQMEVLQTELGVRFPVYLLVTKTDRIIGFREFFEHIDSAEERYQMLGWSNPDPLDKTFDPRGVAGFLGETADRLRRRRMTLMKDPVPAPGRKRFEEVDAMFAFPDSFERLAPKLERYLRHIFAVDEWSAKPPFLRGIYFTSALQQGAVLDEALARALGMTVREFERKGGEEDLSLAKNRSYFLRDFFLEKVFQEKGLITRGNRKKVGGISGWKLWVPLGFASALLLFGIVGWLTGRKPPAELRAWQFLSNDAYSTENYGFYPLVEPAGDGTWRYIEKPVAARALLSSLDQLGSQHLKSRPKFGWLFAPAVTMDGGVKEDRHRSYRIAVNGIVIEPLVEAAIDGMARRAERWETEGISTVDVDALEELLLWFSPPETDDKGKPVPRDVESTVGNLLRSAGLPFTTSKTRDLYRNTIGPLVSSIRAAYPDEVLDSSLIAPADRTKLAGLVERLLGGSGRTDLGALLEDYDRAWNEIRALEPRAGYAAAQEKVRALAAVSERLRVAEPQLNFLMTGARQEGSDAPLTDAGRVAPRQFAKQLVEEREESMRVLAGDRWNRWQDLLDRGTQPQEGAARQQELAKIHGLMLPDGTARNHAARAALCSDILNLDKDMPERLTLAAVESLGTAVSRLQERSKALGMEDTGERLIGFWAEYYIGAGLAKHIGFPLVFDQVRGAQEKVLPREEAAAVASLVVRLAALSDACRARLTHVRAVAESIFDLERLSKGEIAVREWELFVRNDWFAAASEVVVKVPARVGVELRWNAASGSEGKLLAADSGAALSFLDNNVPPGEHTFRQGNQDAWAPVRWAIARISPQAQGAVTTLGSNRIEVLVNLPATFPSVLDQLPATKDFAP